MEKIGVVIPVYNEETRIGALIYKFKSIQDIEVVIVDDGSTDKTKEIVQQSAGTLIRHNSRKGVGASIRDGLDYLLKNNFDIAVVMAGNGKDDPAELNKVIAPILSDQADYIQGSRFLTGGSFQNLPIQRYLMIKSFTWLWSLLVGHHLTDVTNGYRAYRTSLLTDARIQIHQEWLDTYSLEYYVHYKAITLQYRFLEVAVSKNYPSKKKYSKIRPFYDWWSIVKPLFLLRLGIKS